MAQSKNRSNEPASLHVGDGIRAPAGVWTFGGDTPGAFDGHISRSVPMYAECHDLILDIADQLVPVDGRCYDLGCSTSALTGRLAERLGARGAEVIGADREPKMIELATDRWSSLPSIRFATSALEEVTLESCDLVICFYTLQFVPPRDRRSVLERIRSSLEPAGALVLFEKILASTARGQELGEGIYCDFKRRNGFSDDEIATKKRSLRGVLRPVSAEENCLTLQAAGFGEITQIFRWVNFDGVICFPANAGPSSAVIEPIP